MFLWNEFTNDARVLRECTALIEAGYIVQLIALRGKQEKVEKRSTEFIIRRVQFKLFYLSKNWQKILLLLVLTILFLYMPILIGSFGICLFLLYRTKIQFLVRKIILVGKMIYYGLVMKTDIYHANDLNTLFQAIVCGKCFKNKKLIFDSHEVNTSRSGYDSKIYKWLEPNLLRYTDCCIHENHTRARYIKKIYGFYPQVIYNYPFLNKSVDKVNLHKKLGLPENEPILLYQGGLQHGRGLDKLIDAVPSIRRGTVVFIGDGKLKPYLEEKVNQLGLMNRIKFLSKVRVEDLPLYTRNAYLGFQLLNNTSFNHYSAASNKLFEYMMAGVPVIACTFPEIRKVIEKEKTGLLVESNQPNSIAEGVNRLLENPILHEKLSLNACQARQRYNWNEEKEKLIDIYQRVNEGGKIEESTIDYRNYRKIKRKA